MGLGGFLKKTFGKQTCAFCGKEVGMMKRDKIKNDEFICSDCAASCSKLIRFSKFTKEELDGHMEYMKRQDKLFREVIQDSKVYCIPSGISKQGIAFYDECGMFRIINNDDSRRNERPVELIRYDQVASYEPYTVEEAPEQGKPKEVTECGVVIKLVGIKDDASELKPGTVTHPYIEDEIKVTFATGNKCADVCKYDIPHVISHFDYIFGVGDNTRGLFQIGLTKQQKREAEAYKAMGGMLKAAIKAAKEGEDALTEEKKAELMEGMKKVDDANTSGLAEYTRRADAAEAKI